MTLDVTLLVGLAALTLLVVGMLRSLRVLQRRVEDLATAFDRSRALQRRTAAPAPGPDVAPETQPVAALDDDELLPALVGTGSDGAPASVALEAAGPTLVAFLSTTCSICVGVWRRLAAGELEAVRPGVRAVVVTKDPDVEDAAAVLALDGGDGATVVMTSEAWDDYEVPGSPYFLVVDGAPADVVTEGSAQGWEDVVAMVRRVPGG